MASPLAVVILAAGKGSRMKSDLHKVLHPIGGRPMIEHLMSSVYDLMPRERIVIVGHGRDQLKKALDEQTQLVVQEPQLGTGHAVKMSEEALKNFNGDILILYGDVPFIRGETMKRMIDRLHDDDDPAVVVLGFKPKDTLQYGRIITDGDRIIKMIEHKDASDEEHLCRLCNSGIMAVKSKDLFSLLSRVNDNNTQGEYYLTDIVNISNNDGRACVAIITDDEFEVMGINSIDELIVAEKLYQERQNVV